MHFKRLGLIFLSAGVILSLTVGLARADPQLDWDEPFNLSEWQSGINGARLKLGSDGTQAAFWIRWDGTGNQWSLWARVRPPGQPWMQAANLSGWLEPIAGLKYQPASGSWEAAVTPDGTAWAMWISVDSHLTGDKYFVHAAYREPGGSWQNDHPSDPASPATYIRDAGLSMSQDGGLAASWIECAKLMPIEEGPCAVMVRRRFPGAPVWEPLERVDDAYGNTGQTNIQPLAGPGGKAVVMWEESNPSNSSEWGVMARAFNPQSGTWSAKYTPPISAWSQSLTLGQPVMGPDGTVVAAWSAALPSVDIDATYSTTRPVSSGVWSAPTQLSLTSAVSGTRMSPPELAVGEDGTVAAAWGMCWWATNCKAAVNLREPGGTWGSEKSLAAALTEMPLVDVGVWPNGDAIAVWIERDGSRPGASDTRISWSMRTTKDDWGVAGYGQLGEWTDGINGMSFGIGHDHSAVLVWSVHDSNQPAGAQRGVLSASLSPGGSWEAARPISEWFAAYTAVDQHSLVVGTDGQPVAAVWYAVRSISPTEAVFYNEGWDGSASGGNKIYLPLVKK